MLRPASDNLKTETLGFRALDQNLSRLRVASFFAGAGGLDLGFKEAGFDVVYATDIDADCCETLKLNRGLSTSKDSQVVCGDIRDIDFASLPKDVDLVVGGPPCQSFSASGRRAGGAAGRLDDRGNLFEAYRDVIRHLAPAAFVFENVRGILATNKGEDWRSILAAFKDIGYAVDYRLLDAADYGIPQHRERIFLVGHKLNGPFLFPKPTVGPDSFSGIPHLSPREAFDGLRLLNSEAEGLKFEGGKYSHLLPEVPFGQNYLYFTAKRGHPRPVFAYRSRFSDFLYKAHPDYPMKTIIASPGKYTGPLHWENRYFSIAEYKAIQGFPQNYKFHGDRASVIKQIGNSVSPMIAKQVAEAIADQVFGRETAIEYLQKSEVLSFDQRKGAKAAKTREMHLEVGARQNTSSIVRRTKMKFAFLVAPSGVASRAAKVVGFADKGHHELDAYYLEGGKKSATVELKFWNEGRSFVGEPIATLRINLFGSGRTAPQLLWNSVDEWVRHVSSFGSLFEMYGHFTEPHPFFSVSKFDLFTNDPLLRFAKYFSKFARCSRYLDKGDLMKELAETFAVSDFDSLATDLRRIRYDIRTRETNIAIPPGKYMVAYPFTLPQSKQMNFAVKQPKSQTVAESYITGKRVAV